LFKTDDVLLENPMKFSTCVSKLHDVNWPGGEGGKEGGQHQQQHLMFYLSSREEVQKSSQNQCLLSQMGFV